MFLKVSPQRVTSDTATVSPATYAMLKGYHVYDINTNTVFRPRPDNDVEDGWIRVPREYSYNSGFTLKVRPDGKTPRSSSPASMLDEYFDPDNERPFNSDNPCEINLFGAKAQSIGGSLIVHTKFRATWLPPYKHEIKK